MTATSVHEGSFLLKQNKKALKPLAPAPAPAEATNGEHYPTTTDEAREHVFMFLRNGSRLGNNIHDIPTFDSKELLLGRWLGKGGFSDVEELRGFLHIPTSLRKTSSKASSRRVYGSAPPRKNSIDGNSSTNPSSSTDADVIPGPAELGYESPCLDCSESTSQDEVVPVGTPDRQDRRMSESSCAPPLGNEAGRKFLKENCLRNTGEARYAIKRLRKDIVDDPLQYPSGAMDLAVEALFLADLNHPNIIKLRAIATCDPFACVSRDDYYFLVMDRLQCTLQDRMSMWKERKRKLKTLIGRIADAGGRKKQLLLDERLAAAFDLSAAMAYLKQNRIIHRDLKPENLGFDIRGDIKIFDFGLARELRNVDKDPDMPGMYRLSNMTGSLRYMAPEVATAGMPYNEACDVYSFTIVLWEMLSLDRAYMMIGRTKDAFMTKVYTEKVRPPIRHSWSKNIRELLTKGWAHDHTERLTAEQCNEILRNELISMRHGDDEGLDHTRRRSTYVLEGEEEESEGEKRDRRNGLTWVLTARAASMTHVETTTKIEMEAGDPCSMQAQEDSPVQQQSGHSGRRFHHRVASTAF